MTHRDTAISQLSTAAIKAVLATDVEGAAAREAVQLVADLVKRKRCLCLPGVVEALFSLRLREAEIANIKVQGAREGRLHSGTVAPTATLESDFFGASTFRNACCFIDICHHFCCVQVQHSDLDGML